jgi:hypothetical protein
MSNDKMKIPTKLKVGYQKRTDTYTGKLAYVIYYDEKGQLRKERSWDGWRDKKIEADEYSNEPTSGFVLNKKVGDYKSDWNHRMAHIRVYDPRGFEFEISVENLLYILQECTSTKGKGLEGDFVYAFDGSDLVLLPTSSQEYISSREFTDGLMKKVSKADMVEGCVYITKKQEKVMYLGKQGWHETNRYYDGESIRTYEYKGEKHIFAFMDEPTNKYECPYFADTGFTKISSKVSDVIATDYADRFDKFKKSIYGGGIVEISLNNSNPDFKDKSAQYISHYSNYITKVDGDAYLVSFREYNRNFWSYTGNPPTDTTIFEMSLTNKVVIDGNKVTYERLEKSRQVTLKQIKEMEFFELCGKMLSGKKIKIHI